MPDRASVYPRTVTGAVEYGGDQVDLMFDSLTIARRLTEAGMNRELADATADAIREAAEHGDHVTPVTLRAELSGLESRLYRAMLVQAGAIVGALVGIAGIVVGVLRLFG